MNRVTLVLLLSFLFVGVWPVQGQTPTTAAAYVNRGLDREKAGDLEGAVVDFSKYVEIDPRDTEVYSVVGWLLATASKDSIRDGKKAVAFALKGAELTNWEDADRLDTLAAAYAESGNFDEAIKWKTKLCHSRNSPRALEMKRVSDCSFIATESLIGSKTAFLSVIAYLLSSYV